MNVLLPASMNPVKRYTGISFTFIAFLLDFKGCMNLFDVNISTDYADSSDDSCTAYSYIRFARYVVKVNPLAVLTCYNALCTENHAIFVLVFQSRQDFCNFFH